MKITTINYGKCKKYKGFKPIAYGLFMHKQCLPLVNKTTAGDFVRFSTHNYHDESSYNRFKKVAKLEDNFIKDMIIEEAKKQGYFDLKNLFYREFLKKNNLVSEVVYQFREITRREDAKTIEKNIRRTIAKIVDLINANITSENKNKWRFFTATYDPKNYDLKKLNKHIELFLKRFAYYFKTTKRYKNNEFLNYIATVEPQQEFDYKGDKNARLHIHFLLEFKNNNTFIAQKTLEKRWRMGRVDIRKLKGNNIGAYLGAYLGNELDKLTGKKSSRLHLYPANIKILRYSKNVKRPIKKIVNYSESEKLKETHEKVSERTSWLEFTTIETTTGEKTKTTKEFNFETWRKKKEQKQIE